MHTIKAYKTCDGRLFEDETEAASHEATIKICDWAKRRDLSGEKAISWDLVATAMIEDALELAHLFTSLEQSRSYSGGSVDVDEFLTEIGQKFHSRE